MLKRLLLTSALLMSSIDAMEHSFGGPPPPPKRLNPIMPFDVPLNKENTSLLDPKLLDTLSEIYGQGLYQESHLLRRVNEIFSREELNVSAPRIEIPLNFPLNIHQDPMGNEGILNFSPNTSEAIMEIDPFSYKNTVTGILHEHLKAHSYENPQEHIVNQLNETRENLGLNERTVEHCIGVFEASHNAAWLPLVISHVEHPYWENSLTEDEKRDRWIRFFNTFGAVAGFANYGKTTVTSCSPDRAMVEAFESLDEPFAILGTLSAHNAGPLTEEIQTTNPQENPHPDAVDTMGINRRAISLWTELQAEGFGTFQGLSPEESIKHIEQRFGVVRPQKTCSEDVRPPKEWINITFNEEIDFSDPSSRNSQHRRRLAEAMYYALRHKKAPRSLQEEGFPRSLFDSLYFQFPIPQLNINVNLTALIHIDRLTSLWESIRGIRKETHETQPQNLLLQNVTGGGACWMRALFNQPSAQEEDIRHEALESLNEVLLSDTHERYFDVVESLLGGMRSLVTDVTSHDQHVREQAEGNLTRFINALPQEDKGAMLQGWFKNNREGALEYLQNGFDDQEFVKFLTSRDVLTAYNQTIFATHGAWGSEADIAALAHARRMNLTIHTAGNPNGTRLIDRYEGEGAHLYHGGNHYQIVIAGGGVEINDSNIQGALRAANGDRQAFEENLKERKVPEKDMEILLNIYFPNKK